MSDSKKNENILVIAAHPDDELLGCGGTVALHGRAGDRVTFVIACEGESLRYGANGVGQREQIFKAATVVGVDDVRLLDFPDQKLDTITLTEIITPIEKIVRELKPAVVYTQYGGDINRDHEILFKAVMVAVRPTEGYIRSVYAFDTASSTEWAFPRSFVPDTWVDISETLDRKMEALSCYTSEMKEYPHPRSIKALENKARACGNQCCMDAAEAFMTVRRVIRNAETPF